MTLIREDCEGEGNSHQLGSLRTEPGHDPDSFVSQGGAEFQISPPRLARQLLWIIGGLVILSTLGQISRHVYHHGNLGGLVNLFYVDAEANIPTAYSSFTWMLCSVTAAMIAVAKKQGGDRFTKYWQGFALVFAYLALDEVAVLHELLMGPMRSLFNASGFFYYAWVIPGGIFVLVFALSCFKFVKTLPRKTQFLLTLAGVTFVAGAIGLEMIGGWYTEMFGYQSDLTYVLITTLEETLEMLGVLILLYALLSYMGKHTPPIRIKVLSR